MDISIRKLAEAIEISFEIPEAEKKIAHEAKLRFEAFLSALKLGLKHLDIMYESFSKFESIDSEAIHQKRGVLNRYKQKVKENFSKTETSGILYKGLLSIQKLNYFVTGDVLIQEIIVNFSNLMEELENSVEMFLEAIDDYWDPEYRNKILKSIKSVVSDGDNLIELVDERILHHIDDHLLGSSWLENTSEKSQIELDKYLSPIVELYKERQQYLGGENKFVDLEKSPQELSPATSNKMQFAGYTRTFNTEE